MEEVSDISVEACTDSKFVQPFRVRYKQNGNYRIWDCTKVHDSVGILIYNTTRKAFVLVRQFRPAVYMSRHKALWEDSDVFSTPLSRKSDLHSKVTPPVDTNIVQETSSPPPKKFAHEGTHTYGPGSFGCTYELCAGIMDKRMPMKQIAQEEVQEETGYRVPLESLEIITSYYSSMGHAGSHQTVFYCEVTDDMKEGSGGGNVAEGELIDVVYIPLDEGIKLAFDQDKPRSIGLCFALMWFEHYKRPLLKH